MPDTPSPIVVMTHGIFSSRWQFLPLARRLRRDGFDPRLWGYATLRGSNRDYGARFAERLRRLAAERPDATIHLVGHSMGNIVIRCAILAGLPESVGRIVMLAPPNRGSHVARMLGPTHGWISPTLLELTDHAESFVNRLPGATGRGGAGQEVGVLAARHDRVVRPESTRLDDQADHAMIDTWHTGILWRRETAGLVTNFLRTGRFSPATALAESCA
ncbi:Alpha/beta hydrolase family protein [Pseudobythopirellula maris]|uniref:Alpha/beta hydrolase family protein n=1 Tax=Pseudobythopirellula maris TaxID=2527991 RepID=A0A5C5ZNM2_9BACT|nr:alpha/beta fold hydrolase [Pseudobythopirellula maris]TWT89114.1 Alpha/beta hydrolase family protein [Pseudobythopirellula maris]